MTQIKKSSIQGPLDWDLIKSFHCNAPDFALPRTLQVINQYEKHINNFKKNNKTVGQYLKGQFFKNGESYQIEPNLFPYYLENTTRYFIEHYIIWFNEKLNINQIVAKPISSIDKIIKEFIDKTLINNQSSNNQSNDNQSNDNQSNDNIDYIYFENSLKNKSVPEIRHLHLFIKVLKY
jgi:hypothetical protein